MEPVESRKKNSHWKEYDDRSPVEYPTSLTLTTGEDYVNLTFTHWKGVDKDTLYYTSKRILTGRSLNYLNIRFTIHQQWGRLCHIERLHSRAIQESRR